MSDNKRVKTWLQQSIQYLGAALTAAGVTIGAQLSDGSRTSELERKMAENEQADRTAHEDCGHFRSVDLSGFTDPRAVFAVDRAIQRAIREHDRKLKHLNPTIIILEE